MRWSPSSTASSARSWSSSALTRASTPSWPTESSSSPITPRRNWQPAPAQQHDPDAVAACPPTILPGDAVGLLPRLDAARLPDDIPLVVFHAMVRIHILADRRAAFDSAIRDLGRRRRLLHISLEL